MNSKKKGVQIAEKNVTKNQDEYTKHPCLYSAKKGTIWKYLRL